jgi:hypothetical protein
MKRWLLPVAQLIVALVMVSQALFFSAVIGLPLLRDIMTGRLAADTVGPLKIYFWAALLTSLSADIAAVVCLASGAVLLIQNPSRLGAWLSIAGATIYWVYVASHLTGIAALGALRVELTLLDAIDFPIGIVVAVVAAAVYLSEKSARRAAQ